MQKEISLFIDFDSTFIKVESLDILGEISLSNHPKKTLRLEKINQITNLAMSGKVSFSQALIDRIQILEANISQIEDLVKKLKTLVSDSIKRNQSFFKKHSSQIYILSGGFVEFIAPVVSDFGIARKQVFANIFSLDKNGKIIGVDTSNPLSQDQGKVQFLRAFPQTKIYMMGDGYSDYEVHKEGLSEQFFAFTENITRKSVVENSQCIVQNFDEFLAYINHKDSK